MYSRENKNVKGVACSDVPTENDHLNFLLALQRFFYTKFLSALQLVAILFWFHLIELYSSAAGSCFQKKKTLSILSRCTKQWHQQRQKPICLNEKFSYSGAMLEKA